jgi:hypothetical protein
MAIEVLAIANQPEEAALNEKSDAYAEYTSNSANPVVESAEFALLVSVGRYSRGRKFSKLL